MRYTDTAGNVPTNRALVIKGNEAEAMTGVHNKAHFIMTLCFA